MTKISDDEITRAVRDARVIAVVGFSANPDRPVYGVARALQQAGLRIVPVNPGLAGQVLMGETVYASLSDIPESLAVDTVDIFRRPDQVLPVIEEALRVLPHLKTLWLQMGITSAEGAALAAARGVTFIEDLCLKVEHRMRVA